MKPISRSSASPVKMFSSSRQHSRSSRQQTPGSLACCRAPSEVQCEVSGNKLTAAGKIAGCRHILTGLSSAYFFNEVRLTAISPSELATYESLKRTAYFVNSNGGHSRLQYL